MKVSIVIPVYNKEAFIAKCLSKALSQDVDDYEVIAVDDGSKDASGTICDQMAIAHPRLKVIHTENGGVTAARRRGVEEAQGKYIMFCDADDELIPQMLGKSLQAMEDYEADEVIAPYQNQYGTLYDSGRRGFVDPNDIICDFLALHNNFPPIWAILFRRELILDGCLDIPRDIYLGEDILFHVRYLLKASKVYCLSQSNYIYDEGLTSYPKINLAYESKYDQLLQASLQPAWLTLEPFFRLRQLKVYEKFLDTKQFSVYRDYYHQLKGKLSKEIPIADRIVFSLPPRIAYYFIHGYKWWLNKKS